MMNNDYNINIEELISRFRFGEKITECKTLHGGLLHRTFKVATEKGRYVVKALNPNITSREGVLQSLKESEEGGRKLQKEIHSINGEVVDGEVIHEIEGQYYIIYPYLEGKSLYFEDIKEEHAKKMGEVLGKIHLKNTLDEKKLEAHIEMEWRKYFHLCRKEKEVWTEAVEEFSEKILKWDRLYRTGRSEVRSMVKSHRDLDPKNVLWKDGEAYIIDWESYGEINPMKDLMTTALYWSEGENREVDRKKFEALLRGYCENGGTIDPQWKGCLNSLYGDKLAWLHYNLRRALEIECSDQQECELGKKEVLDSLEGLEKFQKNLVYIETIIEEFTEI